MSGAVTDKDGGVVKSTPGNEGRIVHAWANVRGGPSAFAAYLWPWRAWSPGNGALMEAVVMRTRRSTSPWIVASGEDFKQGLWFRARHTFIQAPTAECVHVSSHGSQRRKDPERGSLTVSSLVTFSKEKGEGYAGGICWVSPAGDFW